MMKKLKYIIVILFVILGVFLLGWELLIEEDSCMEAGICPEGKFLNECYPDGSSCVVSKDVCSQLGKKWNSKDKICYFS